MLRNLSPDELRLIDFLIHDAKDYVAPQGWKERLRVADMTDGGMGSLYLLLEGSNEINRSFGKQASECRFADEDGVEVIASLNLDQYGNLYELDVWKADFSKLIKISENLIT